jgi:hypothetical protein
MGHSRRSRRKPKKLEPWQVVQKAAAKKPPTDTQAMYDAIRKHMDRIMANIIANSKKTNPVLIGVEGWLPKGK